MNTTTIATTPSTSTLASAAANCSGALCALGIWEGTAFAELTSVALRNAGGLARLAAAESKFLHNVKESYTSSAVSAPFRSIAEFLAWGNLSTYTSASIRSFFAERGVKEELIATGLAPLTRAIYNRNCDANTFSLLASLTAELSHHSVRGGNYQLVEALFKHAAAEIRVNTTVSHIQFENKTGRFIVTSSSSSSSSSTSSVVEVRVSEVFDKVVIAAPLERTSLTSGCSSRS
jgi:phytoene dehydrogenase-like protein